MDLFEGATNEKRGLSQEYIDYWTKRGAAYVDKTLFGIPGDDEEVVDAIVNHICLILIEESKEEKE